MKKLMIMMVVLGTAAFGRDMEYRERQDFRAVQNIAHTNVDMSARDLASEDRMEDFQLELMHMDRGHQDR